LGHETTAISFVGCEIWRKKISAGYRIINKKYSMAVCGNTKNVARNILVFVAELSLLISITKSTRVQSIFVLQQVRILSRFCVDKS
jgi:hypothetical protein